MTIAQMLAILHLILVHGPDGQIIELNINEISSIREPRDIEGKHFGKGINCIVFMTNGKFVGVSEKCVEVIQEIHQAESPEEQEQK